VESIKLLVRCGCSPNNAKYLPTALLEMPLADAGRTHAPVSRVFRLVLHHQPKQFRHLFVVVRTRASRPQFVVQSGKSSLLIAPPPMAHCGRTHPTAPRHLPIGLSIARQQDNPRTPYQRMRHAARAHHRLQLHAIGIRNHYRFVRSTHPRHLDCYSNRRRGSCNVIYGTLH
jgi:hypothetical protein